MRNISKSMIAFAIVAAILAAVVTLPASDHAYSADDLVVGYMPWDLIEGT